MSLFQARDWWVTKAGEGEEYDVGSLVAGNIDNEPNGAAKIVVGSLNGVLRVYYPKGPDFRIEDLVLEASLDLPILQLAAGYFLHTADSTLALAILHPRKLVICTVEPMGGVGAKASYSNLVRQYEHLLGDQGRHFTACNMCIGPFGGSRRGDLICVQSMDGRLQIFEQDHHAFTRQLENCLVPGPLCYIPKTDSFVTCSSDMRIQSYKYQVLAASQNDTKRIDDGEDTKTGLGGRKKVQMDWSVNIGEHAHHITTARFSKGLSPNQADILVVGEQTIFALKEQGTITLQKRLDYDPSAMCTYLRATGMKGGNEENLIVTTHTKQLLIYKELMLIWSARLHTVPVAIAVQEFGQLPGLIATLSDEGDLAVSYLGTDPPTNAVVVPDAKELNYEEIDEEHRMLLQVIRKSQTEGSKEAREKLMLKAQVPAILDPPNDSGYDAEDGVENDPDIVRNLDGANTAVSVTVRLFLSYTGATPLNNVTINLTLPCFVRTQETSIVIPTIRGVTATPIIIPIVLYATRTLLPSSLDVIASASYTTEGSEPRTANTTFRLPLSLASRLIAAVKNNTYKFTLDTNKPPCQLVPLFEDMFSQPGLGEDAVQRLAGSSNALSFQYWFQDDGAPLDCTILVSKAAGRYRIQSSSLAALWLISEELVRRLQDYFQVRGDSKSEPLVVEYTEPLPLQDFYTMIDHHLESRHLLLQKNSELNDCAHQFRIIEKRLLVRFKDKNPAPLASLDTLMEESFKKLLLLAQEVERAQVQLKLAANQLSCTTYLILMLIRYRFSLDDKNFAVLSSHFCPDVVDNPEQGWEELLDSSMTYLLRTVLAKNAKDSALLQASVTMPTDASKLRKHISIVCDRLNKGHRLIAGMSSGPKIDGDEEDKGEKTGDGEDDGGSDVEESGEHKSLGEADL